jgi:hypothetical protein
MGQGEGPGWASGLVRKTLLLKERMKEDESIGASLIVIGRLIALLWNGVMPMMVQSIITHLVQRLSGLIHTFSLEPEQIISQDRMILEDTILPYFSRRTAIQKVLFVGCAAYTQRYQELFRTQEYWTIDPKRGKRKYGSERHIVDSITNIEQHVVKNYFDVVIMNGVIGFGLNRIGAIEQAIDACYEVLASAGILLVGWNDVARRTPIDIRSLRAINKFAEYHFEPLHAYHYRTEGWQGHTFSFYQKG